MKIEVGENLGFALFMAVIMLGAAIPIMCTKNTPEEDARDALAHKTKCILYLQQQKTAADTLKFLNSKISTPMGYWLGSQCYPYVLPTATKQ